MGTRVSSSDRCVGPRTFFCFVFDNRKGGDGSKVPECVYPTPIHLDGDLTNYNRQRELCDWVGNWSKGWVRYGMFGSSFTFMSLRSGGKGIPGTLAAFGAVGAFSAEPCGCVCDNPVSSSRVRLLYFPFLFLFFFSLFLSVWLVV
ncbi:hypothetical protein BU24DRAFT_110789 [Aaosphaeria arxii CBS 175.79]|uniref:Uncharacterized protein n=1 Tax=Aaosphaeria arxii CBS 175.79 TaxID=1450172 RepID=A0A6A5Y0N8_9PLEO|nr:uncharacterized protein BU24DRAFT_110789 [Aaosphaeria arxii CBS 175.79]KAF2019022.1 hypothetical protein BU24DRAFT_110789 [Aaosphaeria arxii CBS 175.79]